MRNANGNVILTNLEFSSTIIGKVNNTICPEGFLGTRLTGLTIDDGFY